MLLLSLKSLYPESPFVETAETVAGHIIGNLYSECPEGVQVASHGYKELSVYNSVMFQRFIS